MKKFLKNLDQKQIRLLLAVSMLLILFLGYKLGFETFSKKADKVEKENSLLTDRYNELDALIKMEQVYEIDGAKCKQDIELIKTKFGSINTPEKSLRFLVDLQYHALVAIPSIGYSASEEIYSSVDIPSVNNSGVYVYKSPLTISFRTSYQGYKDMIDYIYSSSIKMSIADVSVSFDSETGNLSGSMVIHQYAMTGTEQQYEEPIFNVPNIGTSNIFGTFNIKDYKSKDMTE